MKGKGLTDRSQLNKAAEARCCREQCVFPRVGGDVTGIQTPLLGRGRSRACLRHATFRPVFPTAHCLWLSFSRVCVFSARSLLFGPSLEERGWRSTTCWRVLAACPSEVMEIEIQHGDATSPMVLPFQWGFLTDVRRLVGQQTILSGLFWLKINFSTLCCVWIRFKEGPMVNCYVFNNE